MQITGAQGERVIDRIAKIELDARVARQTGLPVGLERRRVEPLVRDPAAETIGARSDRRLDRCIPSRALWREDPKFRQDVEQRAVGLRHLHHELRGIGRLERLDQLHGRRQPAAAHLVTHALGVRLDIHCGHRATVVEAHALTDPERIAPAIGAHGPGFGEIGDRLAVVGDARQTLDIDLLDRDRTGMTMRIGRIEATEGDTQRPAARRLCPRDLFRQPRPLGDEAARSKRRTAPHQASPIEYVRHAVAPLSPAPRAVTQGIRDGGDATVSAP